MVGVKEAVVHIPDEHGGTYCRKSPVKTDGIGFLVLCRECLTEYQSDQMYTRNKIAIEREIYGNRS